MANRPKTAQLIYEAIEPIVQELGLELVDVELATENSARFLRVYIDRVGGVTIDECAQVSNRIDPVIEQEMKITSFDYLEVSSPGLDRPLIDDRDYVRYAGNWVEVSLYKARGGQKKFLGELMPLAEGRIVIRGEGGAIHTFERSEVAKAKRAVRFE